MKSLKYLLFAFLGLGIVLACDRDFSDPSGDEMAKFNAWIQVHNIPADAQKPSGLYYLSTQEGTGQSPVDGDFVIYSYKEKTLEGIVLSTNDYATAKLYDGFDKNYHYSQIFTKYDKSNIGVEGYNRYMVKGVYEGLSYMKEGGKATLIMPSTLAFGRSNISYTSTVYISPYQSLIYDVELHKVVKNPRDYEKELIQTYINNNYPGLLPINDSIYYKQLTPPTNDTITVGKDSIVYVYYKGMFLDGFVFDTNIDSVARKLGRTFSSKDSLKVTIGQGVVVGFSQALIQMKKGEWGRAIIPSFCGYDSIGNNSIPPYSTLIFDIYFSSKVVVKKTSK